jgi:hypothetical protein
MKATVKKAESENGEIVGYFSKGEGLILGGENYGNFTMETSGKYTVSPHVSLADLAPFCVNDIVLRKGDTLTIEL